MMDEPILSKTARKKLNLRAGELVSKVNKQRLLPGSNKLTPSTRSYSTTARTLSDSFEIRRVHVEISPMSQRTSRDDAAETNERLRSNNRQTMLRTLQPASDEHVPPPFAGAVTTLKTICGYSALEHVENDYPEPKIFSLGFSGAEHYLSTYATEPIYLRRLYRCMRASAAAAGDPNLSETKEGYSLLEHVPDGSCKQLICYKHPIVVPYLYSDGASARAAGGSLCMHSAAARAGDTPGATEATTDALGGSTRTPSPPPTLTDAETPTEGR